MERKLKASGERTVLFVLIGIGLVLLNVLGAFYYARADLTERRLHSLSGGTKRLLGGLDDVLTVRAYFSKNLPPPFNRHERAVRDLLDEYRAHSRGKLRVEIVHPDGNEELEQQAEREGVAKVPHAALQEDQAQEVVGYRGVSFSYRGESKSIPVLSRGADISGLEYDFTTTIRQVLGDKRTIGFVTGHGEPSISPPPPRQSPMEPEQDPGISYLNKLVKNYDLRQVNLAREVPDPAEVRGLVIAGPTKRFSDLELYRLDQYLMRGGALAIFVDGMTVGQTETPFGPAEAFTTTENTTGLEEPLRTYGVQLSHNIVMDSQTDQYLVVGQARTALGKIPIPIPRSYPGWPRMDESGIADDHPLLFRLPAITLLWPSAVRITREAAQREGTKARVLARTTDGAWGASGTIDLDPRQDEEAWLSQRESARSRGRFPLIVEISGQFPSHFAGQTPPRAEDDQGDEEPPPDQEDEATSEDPEQVGESESPGRILVVGDADFMNVMYMGSQRRPRHAQSNLIFLVNTLDWLAEDQDLFEVRAKNLEDPPIRELSDGKRELIKWGNIVAWPALFVAFGAVRWSWRKKRRAQIEKLWAKGGTDR